MAELVGLGPKPPQAVRAVHDPQVLVIKCALTAETVYTRFSPTPGISPAISRSPAALQGTRADGIDR